MISDTAVVQPSADVDEGVTLGERTRVWHLAQVRTGAVLGADCNIGRGAYIGPGVTLGDACKVQNYALVYEPAVVGDGVFIGPAVVFTNDEFPRAANPDGSLKGADDWHAVGVTVEHGASIGARAVCIAPVTIGEWALVAAGAVVTKDVPAHALVAGVPARRIGWVGRTGHPLVAEADGSPGGHPGGHPDGSPDSHPGGHATAWVCPDTGERYVVDGERLRLRS